jgi:hypothetical protein
MKKIEKARKFERDAVRAATGSADSWRPAYHVTPPVGWMNDPNGFCFHRGKVHLFYQYNPYAPKWGPMHWGHCASEDFVSWQRLPAALARTSGTTAPRLLFRYGDRRTFRGREGRRSSSSCTRGYRSPAANSSAWHDLARLRNRRRPGPTSSRRGRIR